MTSAQGRTPAARDPAHARSRPIDRLMAAYALVSAGAFAFPHRGAAWPLLLLLHAAAILAALRLPPFSAVFARTAQRWPRAAGLIADAYPLLLIPLLYAELPALNQAVHAATYFDPLVLGWEESLFGGQPSREWAAAVPWLPLSEVLHASYLSYYFLIYGPPLMLVAAGRRPELRAAVFALMLTFIAHYLFFIFFPVQGPRYLFPAPGGAIADGWFYRLAHLVLEAGSSQGAAFPSSHVGVAMAQIWIAWRWLPRAAPLVTVLGIGLAAGAVYGGFHYLTDVVAGAALGLATAIGALRWHARVA